MGVPLTHKFTPVHNEREGTPPPYQQLPPTFKNTQFIIEKFYKKRSAVYQ